MKTAPAIAARSHRAAIKAQIAAQSTSARSRVICASHLEAREHDPVFAGIRLGELLCSCRGVRGWHMERILEAAAARLGSPLLRPKRRVHTLTDREVAAVIAALTTPWPREAEHPDEARALLAAAA